jgi:hypothetical protein
MLTEKKREATHLSSRGEKYGRTSHQNTTLSHKTHHTGTESNNCRDNGKYIYIVQ